MESPECMWSHHSEEKPRDVDLNSGHYIVRLRVTNDGNEDARDVEVMMVSLWIIDNDGKRLLDSSFLPLMLQWSWWTEEAAPARWLERLPPGTFKHCDLLTVTLEQDPRSGPKRRRNYGKTERPKPWMTFLTAYDPSDASGHNPLRKPPGRYQLDFVTAASNATAIHWTAYINFDGWRNGAAEMFGDSGGFCISVTETIKQAIS